MVLELLSKWTIPEIIIVIVAILAATKQVWSLLSFFYKKIRCHFDSEFNDDADKTGMLEKLAAHEENSANRATEIKMFQEECERKFEIQNERLELLTNSDMDSIKSYVVKEYHYFTEQQGWIDDFSLDVLERRFCHYQTEGGNSYVEDLMVKIRSLPNHPPVNY